MPTAVARFSLPQANEEDILAALTQDGVVILENFISPAILEGVNGEIDEIMHAEASLQQGFPNEGVAAFFGEQVGHVTGVAGKCPAFVDHLLCHPLYMAACDAILLPNCADYQLNLAHVLQREPGSEAQFLHRDEWVWKRLPPLQGEVQLASLLALTDFSADNGGTLVVPGSHRWPEDRYPEPQEAVATEMAAGSAIIYLGSTYHGGGSNITDTESRRGMHVSYCLGWLRTEENLCLATPAEKVRAMPQRAQQLLGFGIHDDIAIGGGYLGAVELEEPSARL